jgi:hypothetical protein
MLLVRVPDDNVQSSLTKIRDADPFFQKHLAHYEMIPWMPVIGKEDLDKI